MADGFEPGQLQPQLPMARLHGAAVDMVRMKRSLVYGTVVAVTWLVPLAAVALSIVMS
jgi:hypothetical protein